jgi:hypothetical protein
MADLTPEQMREHIEEAPMPLEGEPIHERFEGDLDKGYDLSGRSLARALLLTAEEKPELLDVSQEREKDPSGWAAANNEKLWTAAKEKFPGLDDWLGGITGFQFGWAHNAIRYVLGAEATGNPAIATIGKTEG